jgi:hypothetical protein
MNNACSKLKIKIFLYMPYGEIMQGSHINSITEEYYSRNYENKREGIQQDIFV